LRKLQFAIGFKPDAFLCLADLQLMMQHNELRTLDDDFAPAQSMATSVKNDR